MLSKGILYYLLLFSDDEFDIVSSSEEVNINELLSFEILS